MSDQSSQETRNRFRGRRLAGSASAQFGHFRTFAERRDAPCSLFPVLRGEGGGERVGARGDGSRGPALLTEDANAFRLHGHLAPLPCPLPRSTVGEGV